MNWPSLICRIRSISHGPRMKEITRAVSAAQAVRNVMYRKTLNPEIRFRSG